MHSSEQTESLGSATPDSLNEQTTWPVPPAVEDLGSDMETDSFHSLYSTRVNRDGLLRDNSAI